MATDGEVLAELLCMIDNSPRPSLLFGAPALSVSQVETNLSLSPGALEAARLKAIIEPLADSLFDKPRKVTIRDLHRGGNVEFWIVFEELALTERPSSVPKLAKLPPLIPHPIASRQSKVGLGDRLKAVAAQDAPKTEPTPGPSVIPPDTSALTGAMSENGRVTREDIANVAVSEPSEDRVAGDIAARDQEQGAADQNTPFTPAAKQAVSAGLNSHYDQVDFSAPLEPYGSVSPQRHLTADMRAASAPIDINPEVNEDRNMVGLPSPAQAARFDLKQGVNLDEDADGPTRYAAQSPVDAFEFDMVDLLSPADVADPFAIEMPRVDDVSLEVERPPQSGPPDSPSSLLTPDISPRWESEALAPVAAPNRVSTDNWSPQLQESARGRPPQVEIIQPAGLVVNLDLPDSSSSSDDKFELEVRESSSSSGTHDGQGFEELQPAYNADEAIEVHHPSYPDSEEAKREPEPNSVEGANWDRAEERFAQAPLARPEVHDIWPPASLGRAPQLAHYTSPLPSPRFLADRAQAPRSSTPPPTRRLVVDDDDYPGPHVEPFGSPEGPEGMQDPRLLDRGGQSPGEETKWHEENEAQHISQTASTASDRDSSFSLDDLLPSATREQIDLASAQDSPLSPTARLTGTIPTSPVPTRAVSEDEKDAIEDAYSSPPTSPARTDVSESEYDSDSAVGGDKVSRLSDTKIMHNPPQHSQDADSWSQNAPDSSVLTAPADRDVDTPPITPFVDKVFRDLPFAPRLPPALQPGALRQHGHRLAYELVAVLVVFLLLIPA